MSKLAIQAVSKAVLGVLLALGALASAFGVIGSLPNNAYAASETALVANNAKAASETALLATTATSASKKVTLPVVTKVTINSPYGTVTESFSYTAKGLVKSLKNNEHNTYYSYDLVYTDTFAYTKGNKLKSIQYAGEDGQALIKYTFTRDKKGRVVKCASNQVQDGVDLCGHTYKYNKKSQLSKYTFYYNDGTKEKHTQEYVYDKNGNVKTILTDGWDAHYTSDKKGKVTKMTNPMGTKLVSSKNTYKGNKLVKRVAKRFYSSSTEKYTYTFKYKNVKVPASLARMVKAQQYAIAFDQRPASVFDGMADYPLLFGAN